MGWLGRWRGPVTGDDVDYDVEVEVFAEGDRLRGQVAYPQLECGGEWTETGRGDSTRDFEEVIQYEGSCIVVVQIRLTMDGDVPHTKSLATPQETRRLVWRELQSCETLIAESPLSMQLSIEAVDRANESVPSPPPLVHGVLPNATEAGSAVRETLTDPRRINLKVPRGRAESSQQRSGVMWCQC